MKARLLTRADLTHSAANFMALFAGAGLSPRAPGTVGTVAAIPVYLLMPSASITYALLLALLFVIGVWCCGVCARNLDVHDHGGIVWDEVVGYLLTMLWVPAGGWWILAGFVIFRLFDVIKPWPIGWVDRRVHGGLGIMLDDVIAGLMAGLLLHLGWRLFG